MRRTMIRMTMIGLALLLSSCGTYEWPLQGFGQGFGQGSGADMTTQPVDNGPINDPAFLRDSATPRPALEQADAIVVYKSRRMLYLMKEGHILKKFRVALGKNPIGHKMQWGDNRTPEGKYIIDLKNNRSSYFLSMRISYPDRTDADVAAALDVRPGDWIMIHGMPNDRGPKDVNHPNRDWTNGCIAVTNPEMAEIWQRVQVGTPISIWP